MIDQTSDGNNVQMPAGRRRRTHCAVLGGICALVIGVYVWSAHSGMMELSGSGAADSYYNLLVKGFRAGQLNLKAEVPPGLAHLADPYVPSASFPYRWITGHPLHDLSYYHGKLYLYFGITPALVLFWPYAVLTGHYLLHKDAVVIFCAVGFLTSAGLLWGLWRRYFGEVSFWVVMAGVVALGLGSGLPVMLPRSDVYEVPISCGYALVMLALAALWRALHDSVRRSWWLAAASLAYGLAVGARPSLLFGAVILLVPVAQAWRERRPIWVPLLAAGGPIVLIGLGLMLYNALRFDNPFVFGGRYQLSGLQQYTVQPFSLRYLWFNFRVYFLEPASWGGGFPFVQDPAVPPMPSGHGPVEHPIGVLTNLPLVWLALAVSLAGRGQSAEARSTLWWFVGTVGLLFGICALTLGLFFTACVRFEMEFLPQLVLLAVMGVLGLERALADRLVWRRVVHWGWGLLVVGAVAFNLLVSIGRQGEFHYGLGFALLKKGQVDEAVAQFHKALQIRPSDEMAHANLGVAFLQKGQVDEAIAHCQRALEIQTNFPLAHKVLLAALVRKGRLDEAIAGFEKTLAAQPNNAEEHNNLGNALLQKGQTDAAMVHFQRAVDIQPDYAEARYNLATLLLQKNRTDESIAHFQKTVKIQPDYVEAHNNLGNALLRRGRVDEAIVHLQTALAIQPKFAQVHFNLGAAMLQRGQTDEAIVHFQRAVEIQPEYAEAHNNLGVAFLRKGQVDEAMVHFKKVLDVLPGHAEAHYGLGIALLKKGQLDEAIAHFQTALKTQPGFALAHNSLGYTLSLKGQVAKAIDEFQEVLRLEPDSVEASNNLAAAIGMKRAAAPQTANPAKP